LLIERHESPSYDHEKAELWTYVQPALKGVVFEALNPYWHLREKGREDYTEDQRAKYGPLVVVAPAVEDPDEPGCSLEEYEGMDRKRGWGDGSKVEALNWHWSGHEELPDTLTPEGLALVDKLKDNLTAKERTILEASVGRSLHQAAEYLGIPYATYWRWYHAALDKAKSFAPS
jgi:hypothetical protein